MSTMQYPQSSAGFDFVASGDLLAVDLVNTEIVTRRKAYDLLQTPQDVVQWFAMLRSLRPDENVVDLAGTIPPDLTSLQTLKSFRTWLRRFFGTISDGNPVEHGHVETINTHLQSAHLSLHMIESDARYKPVVHYHAKDQAGAAIQLACAISTMRFLTELESSRLHRCRNPQCVMFFYDRTRSGTREWCSVECMDRARSAERYRLKSGS